jgi:hypothetical protein
MLPPNPMGLQRILNYMNLQRKNTYSFDARSATTRIV